MKFKDYLQIGFVILFILFVPIGLMIYSRTETSALLASSRTNSYSAPLVISDIGHTQESEEETKVTQTQETTESYTSAEPEDDLGISVKDCQFVDVDTSYFDDAVFIGNSRLQGFILYSKVPDLTSYTYVGMTVASYFTKESFTVNGVLMTAAQALENTEFSKVYLKFGINEMGWTSTSQFADAYAKVIEHVFSCNPDATVFIMSVLPVSKEAIEKDPILNKDKIIEFNNTLQEIADEYGACFLDIYSVFADEEGYMPQEYSSDGIHLNASSVQQWLEYLLSHGVER
jgi:hypothetical protein